MDLLKAAILVKLTKSGKPFHRFPIGKQQYQLPEPIPSNSDSDLRGHISISIHTQHTT